MGYAIGDLVWLRRDSDLVSLRSRVGTNVGKVGDVWSDDDGERISVVYEDEQVLALDLAASEFVMERAPTARPSSRAHGALPLPESRILCSYGAF